MFAGTTSSTIKVNPSASKLLMSNFPSTVPVPATVIHTQSSAATEPQSEAAPLSSSEKVPTHLLLALLTANPTPLLSSTAPEAASVGEAERRPTQ